MFKKIALCSFSIIFVQLCCAMQVGTEIAPVDGPFKAKINTFLEQRSQIATVEQLRDWNKKISKEYQTQYNDLTEKKEHYIKKMLTPLGGFVAFSAFAGIAGFATWHSIRSDSTSLWTSKIIPGATSIATLLFGALSFRNLKRFVRITPEIMEKTEKAAALQVSLYQDHLNTLNNSQFRFSFCNETQTRSARFILARQLPETALTYINADIKTITPVPQQNIAEGLDPQSEEENENSDSIVNSDPEEK